MNTIGISTQEIEYLTFHRQPPDVTLLLKDDSGQRTLLVLQQSSDLKTLRFLRALMQGAAQQLAVAMSGPTIQEQIAGATEADGSGSAYEPQFPDHSEREQARQEGWGAV